MVVPKRNLWSGRTLSISDAPFLIKDIFVTESLVQINELRKNKWLKFRDHLAIFQQRYDAHH